MASRSSADKLKPLPPDPDRHQHSAIPPRHAPSCGRARPHSERLRGARGPLGGGAQLRLARALGGLLRDRAGRLDVSAARIAFAAVLSGVEALLNPMPTQDVA